MARWIGWMILGLALIYIVFWFVQIQRAIRVGKGLVAKTVAYEQQPAVSEKTLLVLGDSTAQGVGADRSEESVSGRIGSDYPTLQITNKGKSGLVMREVIPFLEEETGSYDVILIQIGGNDAVDFRSKKKFENDARQVVEGAQSISDHLVMTSPGNFRTVRALPFGLRWVWNQQVLRQRTVMKALEAEYGFTLVDLYRPFTEEPMRSTEFYAPDQFHPSSEGYRLMYEDGVGSAVKKALP